MSSTSFRAVLDTLTQDRLTFFGRSFDVGLPAKGKKQEQITALTRPGALQIRDILRAMTRDELRAACRRLELDDTSASRVDLMDRLSSELGSEVTEEPEFLSGVGNIDPWMPRQGNVVLVRQRNHLVEAVEKAGGMTRVSLVCLDDDNQGRRTEVLWELELGARIIDPEASGLGDFKKFDEPRAFGAYLHTVKWNCVSATDGKLFQSPFRAGIKLMNHQLTALRKALQLPRVNLFIADDVGLGKTIEAGLVLQEMLLRQRADWVLVVCPASVALQWRDEMQKKFGLQFELYNRAFISRRRKERGFGVNPWSTHNRFIITYQTLRRPEYRDPLLQHLSTMSQGEKARKSMLILDEAHTAAPASASAYAVDSGTTKVIRDVAPRFENRLFLSATPHNGHSNSFSSLLEILDPQRFTRGVPTEDPAQLDPVMVRRLKEDLRKLGEGSYPKRHVGRLRLSTSKPAFDIEWSGPDGTATEGPWPLFDGNVGEELELSRQLAEYTELMAPKKGRSRLVFINLQKRLLSSVEAFVRTLKKHDDAIQRKEAAAAFEADEDDSGYGVDDDLLEAQAEAEVGALSAGLDDTTAATALRGSMLETAERIRGLPDAKVHALVRWMQEQLCPAISIGERDPSASTKWSDKRVIIFTEYGDTKRYLLQALSRAISGTDQDEERIMQLHGGMGDDSRAAVQRAFNAKPDEEPVRILIATDAAREGINLQAACADLFHFDVPWNPSRMEQRNGRIDRTLQPQPDVRCMYFTYDDRDEDKVLATLVDKVERIREQLGSVGEVVMGRFSNVLDKGGIDNKTISLLDAQEDTGGANETARRELDGARAEERQHQERLRQDIDLAGKLLSNSRKVMDFAPALLREAIDAGLEMSGHQPLTPVDGQPGAYTLPELGPTWQPALDWMREPIGKDESFWEWRKKPPVPVVFEPPDLMTTKVAHLHLHHPFVQRVTSLFAAQGFSAHDLSRVTILRSKRDDVARVIVFGRLTLFGPGAVRLHDKVISVAAKWLDSKGAGHLKPFADAADQKAVDQFEETLADAPGLDSVSDERRNILLQSAPDDFKTLWKTLSTEADAQEAEAIKQLQQRGEAEAQALETLLRSQQAAIRRRLGPQQISMDQLFGHTPETASEKEQAKQLENDRKHMESRLDAIEREVASQPDELRASYEVALTKVVPVGMVYLWPSTRG